MRVPRRRLLALLGIVALGITVLLLVACGQRAAPKAAPAASPPAAARAPVPAPAPPPPPAPAPPPAAEDRLKTKLLADLKAFMAQFKDYEFNRAISLGNEEKFRTALATNLDIEVDPSLGPTGKYRPPAARWFGGVWGKEIKNSLLSLKNQPGSGADATVWHETLHHLIKLKGGEPCLQEEAYMQNLEVRVSTLSSQLVSFETQFGKQLRSGTDQPALRKRWQGMAKGWTPSARGMLQNLLGPYEWEDSDDSCGEGGGKRVRIESGYIAGLDAALGMNMDINKICAFYEKEFKIQLCTEPKPAPIPAAKLPGRIYLGASPYQAKAQMNHGLFIITAADGRWELKSPRAIDGIAISPDGTKLAAGMLQETGAGPGDPQLAFFDAKDPGFKPLTSVFGLLPSHRGPQQLTGPAWAKDSSMLVVSRVGDLHLYEYFLRQGSQIIWPGWQAVWSPTDSRLVIAGDGLSILDDALKGGYTYDPWTVGTVFQTPRQGAVTKVNGAPSDATHPEWSPDGKNILFVSKGAIWVIAAAGGSPKALTPEGGKARAPAYSPDGSYIAFARLEPEPDGGIWVMKADGSEPRQVVRTSLANIGKIDLDWGP